MVKRLPPLTRVDKVVLNVLSKNVLTPKIETLKLEDVVGRVSAENVTATIDVPPYNRSAVDGYAVRASDTFTASIESPVKLEVVGRVLSGETPKVKVEPGTCVYIATGAVLPEGCDAVVMVEYTREYNGVVEVYKPVTPFENVSKRGEDFKAGDLIVKKGEILKPWHVAALAATGKSTVKVYSKFKAIVYSTGDEIVEPGEELVEQGKVYDSTRKLVISYLKSLGLKVVDGGILSDDISSIREEVLKSVNKRDDVDFIFLTGGSSVGEKDYTVKAVVECGGEIIVHGVAIKPGRPMAIGLVGGKLVFILSGLPIAAYVELEAVFKPVIEKLYNLILEPKPKIKGELVKRVNVEPGIRGYVRVRVYKERGRVYVEPLVLTGSGIISSMLRANGLLVVPEEIEGYDEGDEVEIVLTSEVEEIG